MLLIQNAKTGRAEWAGTTLDSECCFTQVGSAGFIQAGAGIDGDWAREPQGFGPSGTLAS